MLLIQHIKEESAELEKVRHLFSAYAKELDADLCFQGFTEELKDPLKKYGPPTGALFLAYYHHEPVGTIALQALPEPGVCEMKRLFVLPHFRKHKVGEQLVIRLLEEAKALGYISMKLDTLDRLQPAISLYLQHGFTITHAYYDNPLAGVVYMEKTL